MSLISIAKVTGPVSAQLEFTEHNRQPVSLDYEVIENTQRTADGTMRKYIVAKKRSFNLSWQMLPSLDSLTIDSKSGAATIKKFYEDNLSKKLTLALKHYNIGSSTSPMVEESVDTFISSFSYEIVKRLGVTDGSSGYDYVNVSIGFTEA